MKFAIFVAALALISTASADGAGNSGQDSSVTVLRGQLEGSTEKSPPDKPLTLIAEKGKEYRLLGDEYSLSQLRDPRLAGRTWEFEGEVVSEGQFRIHKLFTVVEGQRHVVKYYCNICHIYTHSPGRCMCCQGETELKEIPE